MFDAALSQNVQPAATAKVAEISKTQIPVSRQFSKPKFQKGPNTHSLKRATKWDLSFELLEFVWDLGFAESGLVSGNWDFGFPEEVARSEERDFWLRLRGYTAAAKVRLFFGSLSSIG